MQPLLHGHLFSRVPSIAGGEEESSPPAILSVRVNMPLKVANEPLFMF